jgi:hypothetical protein
MQHLFSPSGTDLALVVYAVSAKMKRRNDQPNTQARIRP